MATKRIWVAVIAAVIVASSVGLFVLPDNRGNTVAPENTETQTTQVVDFTTRTGRCTADFVGESSVFSSGEDTIQIKGNIVTTDNGRLPVVENITQSRDTVTVSIGTNLTRNVTNRCTFYSTYELTAEVRSLSTPFTVVVRHDGVQNNATITESTVQTTA